MNTPLLNQLFDGEIYPDKDVCLKEPKDEELNRTICDEIEYFKSILSPENWRRFGELENMLNIRTSAYEYAYFTYGFRLAVGLIIEGITKGEHIVLNTN